MHGQTQQKVQQKQEQGDVPGVPQGGLQNAAALVAAAVLAQVMELTGTAPFFHAQVHRETRRHTNDHFCQQQGQDHAPSLRQAQQQRQRLVRSG